MGHLEVVQALLTAGADTATKNKLGYTALACASRGGHTAVAAALQEYAARARPRLDHAAGAADSSQ
jgi:ankyrin repeat protein